LLDFASNDPAMTSLDRGENGASLATSLRTIQLSVEELQEVSTRVSRRSIKDVLRAIEGAIERLAADDFSDASAKRATYESCRARAKRSLDFVPGAPTTRPLRECLRAIVAAELADWTRLSRRHEARPRLITQANLNLTLSKVGEVLLPLKVVLDEGPVAARGIRIVLDQHRGVETVGNAPTIPVLQPGQAQTVRVRLKDRRRQGAKNEVRVSGYLEYLGPTGDLQTSPRQDIVVRLSRPAEFVAMPNPFRDYASGAPVDDPAMFFGRATLIAEIVSQLVDRPVGRCYALFGQKRSGKSSVVSRVQASLTERGVLVARLSMGVVDRSAITQTFVSEVLDQLREQVGLALDADTFANLLTRWPESSSVAAQPLASLRKALTAARALLKAAGHGGDPRVVIIVDEFTYLFELLRRDHVAPADQDQLRDFMRQWKSLLEAKIFSAMIVGQDTMPGFIDAFPNEFSVMHSERLDYLTADETEALADLPIQREDGSSRFSGYGLSTIYSYTSGHPYFTQILCDRIVELANANQRNDIADFDVDAALETLLEGSREIGMYRFDCLLTADNTGVLLDAVGDELGGGRSAEDAAGTALRLTSRMAILGGAQSKPVDVDELEMSAFERRVFDDLVRRGVVVLRDRRAQLRVLLFAEYLRRTQQ
jgi:hypothetical protein